MLDSSPDGGDTSQQRLPYFRRLATPSSVQPLALSETWGCFMDSGLFRLLSCAARRSAYLAGLCGLHAACALEGALLTATPPEGRELSVSLSAQCATLPPRGG